MKQCPKCFYSNEDFNTVCSSCGSPLDSTTEYNTNGSFSPPVQVKTNSYAIASMVLGIVSIPLVCCCYIGVITGILAVIFGFLARNKIKSSYGAEKGEGMALAGIITGFVAIGLVIVLLIIAFAGGGFSSTEFMEEFQRQMEQNIDQ
ncbi:MAG: DUF4190 domain-containing protein [Bacillota bacterium]